MAKNIRIDENTSFNPESGEFINSNTPPTTPPHSPIRREPNLATQPRRYTSSQNELERAANDADNENLLSSIGIGILWALIGLPIGFIAGGIIGFVFSMIYIIVENASPKAGDEVMNTTMWIIIVICSTIGFFGGFISKREKK